MDKNKFSLTLQMHRKNAGLTQKQVADALNIERSTYAYYETGVTKPSGTMILKLAAILGIDYHIFMDAVGDVSFNESPEDLSYTTLEDSSALEREKMYTLRKREQTMITKYRLLTDDQKDVIDNMIDEFKHSNEESIKSKSKKKTNGNKTAKDDE